MARVALGRAGNGLPTREMLAFQLAHARARDAVHTPLDPHEIAADLGCESLLVSSAARTRDEYLLRPDLGRQLGEPSRRAIQQIAGPFDVVFIVADGLSPLAVQKQAVPLLHRIMERLEPGHWRCAPFFIALQARVALSDEIGALTHSSLAVMLIGERPGLSASDSIGAYLTWSPQPGRTDADRNCISNIRPEGLSIGAAAELLFLLMRESRARRISGVLLKPDTELLRP